MRTACALTASLAFASGAAGAEPLRVVTSIETFASLARAVGGERVVVEPLARGYQDPHFVEAKPSLLVTLHKADLLVYAGLDLELGWLPPLVAGSRNPNIQPGAKGSLDASGAIDVLDVPAKVDRAQGDIHPRGNPHFWLPPVNGLRVAKVIAERLSELDPQSAASYGANLKALGARLKERAPAWQQKAAALKGLKVVTYHKSWTYLSQWLGLEEVGYVENKPGIQPDPKHLAKLITLMKGQGVRVVLIEAFQNRGIAGRVAEAAGAKLVVLPSDVGATPELRDYVELVDAVLEAMSKAAK